ASAASSRPSRASQRALARSCSWGSARKTANELVRRIRVKIPRDGLAASSAQASARATFSGHMSTLAEFVARRQLRLLHALPDWLRIPSVSTLPEHAPDCRKAAEWLAARLKRLGFRVDTIETERHPILWAEGPTVPGAPTILCYGHYDVQPP